MSEKRKRNINDVGEDGAKNNKKPKRGFTVGPQNLPDGTYRRKTQKIKSDLIEKAKIKKNYAKLKRQTNITNSTSDQIPVPATRDQNYQPDQNRQDAPEPATTSPHPDRQAMINSSPLLNTEELPHRNDHQPRPRKPKHQPFQRQYSEAQRRKAEAEERRKAREEAERQRQSKLEERERFRKAMAKARTGGRNGQRKLGRESKVLLERVRRMTASDR